MSVPFVLVIARSASLSERHLSDLSFRKYRIFCVKCNLLSKLRCPWLCVLQLITDMPGLASASPNKRKGEAGCCRNGNANNFSPALKHPALWLVWMRLAHQCSGDASAEGYRWTTFILVSLTEEQSQQWRSVSMRKNRPCWCWSDWLKVKQLLLWYISRVVYSFLCHSVWGDRAFLDHTTWCNKTQPLKPPSLSHMLGWVIDLIHQRATRWAEHRVLAVLQRRAGGLQSVSAHRHHGWV